MSKKNTSSTIKDVAREAGVSLGTVSKVINGIPVGETYRLRVEAAIEKLGYRVDYYAKGMKSKHTYTLAVMLPNLSSPYFSMLADHLNNAITQRGYQMMVFCTDHDPHVEQKFVTLAEQKRVDGIIGLSFSPGIRISEEIPFVSIDRFLGNKFPCVASDNFGGGWIAAEKLVQNGCSHLAFLRIGSPIANEPNKRKDGFIQYCEQMGIEYTVKIVNDNMPYSEFDDFLHAHLHNGKLDFDGIFCITDSLAYYILGIIQTMNLRVPEDIQVIGFDGLRKIDNSGYYCSTIVQPVQQIAETCVCQLLDEKSSFTPALICLPVEYAYGGTTKE